jgi:hypothetical protein
MLGTPVSLHVFNRPAQTARLISVLRAVRPPTLFVHADGPRPGNREDERKCAQVREQVDGIDWPCRIVRNYADANLGSFRRNTSAFDFLFAQVEEAIILEDDCIPDPSFFRFCEELLDRYRDDDEVALVSGFSPLPPSHGGDSYFFSKYPMTWGWATWRRTWRRVDLGMEAWPDFRRRGLRQAFPRFVERQQWRALYDAIHDGRMRNAWDYQLMLACWMDGLRSIAPRASLVSNIGFGQDATHTGNADSPLARIQASGIQFPLRHPAGVAIDAGQDAALFDARFRLPLRRRVKLGLKSWLGGARG